ncbi:MAG: hypothetical protein LBE71_01275, partial [Dysgonamonadaceae bacterium]|nr:hypothetical protein [Dysgonamonadaceae bacterium]
MSKQTSIKHFALLLTIVSCAHLQARVVVTETEYDSRGRAYRSFLPGYDRRSEQYSEVSWDEYGRKLT